MKKEGFCVGNDLEQSVLLRYAEGFKQIAVKKLIFLFQCPQTLSNSVYYGERQIEKGSIP